MSKIVKKLKELFPEKQWKCERNYDGFGWVYVTEDGWRGEFRSCLVSTHPGDADGHATDRFFIYKPDGSSVPVSLLDRNKVYPI